MILIKEQEAKHIPGLTSLFIHFPYDANIIACMKCCDVFNYDKKTTCWEVPITSLSMILNCLHNDYDIKVELLPDAVYNDVEYDLLDYKTKPFKHQIDAIQYGLQENHKKWLLLDCPGLGKTLTMICLAQEIKKRDNISHCLIICGVNTLKINWKNEIQKHCNLSCRILGERLNKKGKYVIGGIQDRIADLKRNIDEFFVITNIETLRNNDFIKCLTKGKNKFDMIVVDEVHCIKNIDAIQTTNMLKLSAPYQIGLTGTLLTNDPLDLFVPLKWIGAEHSAQSTFKYHYYVFGGNFNKDVLGYKNMNQLKEQLSSCSLRRTKDLLSLPEKTIIHEIVEMNADQKLFYDNIKQGIVDQVDKVHITTTNLLGIMARLRQATACPSILTNENISSSKIERCVDHINEVVSNGDKIVVFSTFKETLNVIKNKILDLNPLVCTGDIKDSEINDCVHKFQNDDNYKVILATWSKMGTGITLTAANYACFIDCPYTAANCEQAEDRIHRIGSSKPVFIYYLWAKDTVDERVKEIVEDKSLISSYVIDDNIPPQLFERLKSIVYDLK